MMADWSLLPGIIVVEVLSYLPLTDRLNSSSTCRGWRNCLFYPSLWRGIHFSFTKKGRRRARLLAERCGTFVRDCTVVFDSKSVVDLRGVLALLQQLSRNPLLERLTLKPTSCRISWTDATRGLAKRSKRLLRTSSGCTDVKSGTSQVNVNSSYRECRQNAFIDLLHQICRHSPLLKHLSLGCIEELTEHRESLLAALLSGKQSGAISVSDRVRSGDDPPVPCLSSLHVNSIKEDLGDEPQRHGSDGAEGEAVAGTPRCRVVDLLLRFSALRRLSIDADDASDRLLLGLSSNGRTASLDSLTLTVHEQQSSAGVSAGHGASNAAWEAVRRACPNLRVTVNMLHSYEGTRSILTKVLRPAMPLVHFRSLFCGLVNATAITFMARHYCTCLESVTIIEGLDGHVPMFYDAETEEDPFVMLAWKCSRLRSFAVIGVALLADDVVAIARLRGTQLHTFAIPDCCLMFMRDADELDYGSRLSPAFTQQVSESLGYEWRPLEYEELHAAVKSECADADTAYLGLLLSDHQLVNANDKDNTETRPKLAFGVAVPAVSNGRRL